MQILTQRVVWGGSPSNAQVFALPTLRSSPFGMSEPCHMVFVLLDVNASDSTASEADVALATALKTPQIHHNRVDFCCCLTVHFCTMLAAA